LRPLKLFQARFLQTRYEEKFSRRLLSEIRKGDVVWDIGANLGHYTDSFRELVGSDGLIVAFEPAPACFRTLKERFQGHDNVKVENVAVGRSEGRTILIIDENPLAPTHQIRSDPAGVAALPANANTTEVNVVSGDSYFKRAGAAPGVIKIDVEGFEEQVFLGMGQLLKTPQLRAVFCEVHFGILERRGERMAPVRIERLLQVSGFAVSWIDASHLGAVRTQVPALHN
jgi:FkbM family methyltransferase